MKPVVFVKGAGALLAALFVSRFAFAQSVESFEIQGLTSPASPPALVSELESRLDVKVVELQVKNTESGWPVLRVEFDPAALSRADIANAIAAIEDPAGHHYAVHSGPGIVNAPYLDEEMQAAMALGPADPAIESLVNPREATAESLANGEALYNTYCTTCHGLDGSGQGPASHGITTFPRQLWIWHNADASADGYLYWFITNGRNEMPPWGVILSENDRWDVINHIKTALTAPE